MKKKYSESKIVINVLGAVFTRKIGKTNKSKINKSGEYSEGLGSIIKCSEFNLKFGTTIQPGDKDIQLEMVHQNSTYIVPVSVPPSKSRQLLYIAKTVYQNHLLSVFGPLDQFLPPQEEVVLNISAVIQKGIRYPLIRPMSWSEFKTLVRNSQPSAIKLIKLTQWDGFDQYMQEFFNQNVIVKKPSVDHRIPVSVCYELGMTVNETNDITNLRIMELELNFKKNGKMDEVFFEVLKNEINQTDPEIINT